MIKSASVALMISSTETPGALSNNLKPFGVISKTANSVTTFFTQPTPVNGSVHFLRIFDYFFMPIAMNYCAVFSIQTEVVCIKLVKTIFTFF